MSLVRAWLHRPTHRSTWALAAPMILSNLSIPLVALTDTAVIGHLPHSYQLGAAALGAGLYSALVGLLGFLRMGTTGFAAQACGRADSQALRQVLLQALACAGALALLVALGAPWLIELALRLSESSGNLTDLVRDYLYTRLFGLPAALGSYALIGWFLGSQNARAPLAMLLATNLANIALDLWFVLGLDWGVAGAARASVIAEWLGLVIGLTLACGVLRGQPGHFELSTLFRRSGWSALLSVNRDIFVRSLLLQSVFVLIAMQGARLGDTTVAANALLLNGLMLTAFALDGLAHALEALSGHAIGARDRTALRRALVVCGGWALLASLAFSGAFLLAGESFLVLQSDIAPVRQQALEFLPYLAVLPPIAVVSYLLDGLFIAATRAREMRNAMLLAVLLSLPLGWLSLPLGNHGLWLTFLAFMLLRGALQALCAWRLQQRQLWIAADSTASQLRQ